MDAYTLNLFGSFALGCSDVQDAAMAAAGLAKAELAALLAVHARPGSTVGEVAVTAGLTHSGAVRVVDRLSGAGLVVRRTGPDRRTVSIRCTPDGRKRAKLALELRRTALADAVARLTSKELTEFRRLAKKFLAGLPRSRSDAWRICRFCDHGVCSAGRCPVGGAVP